MDLIMILMWIGWVAFAIVLIFLIYLILAFVWPSRNSAARFFIEGRRKNMPVVALDNGSRWIFKVAKKTAPGLIIDDDGLPIETTPKSLKWGGGVYFGVGEFFRSKLANITVVDFLTQAKAKGWSDDELAEKLTKLDRLVDEKIKNIEHGKDKKGGADAREKQSKGTDTKPDDKSD